jgi:hypothetical protein
MNDKKNPMKSKTILTNSAVLAIMPLLKAFGIEPNTDLILSLLPLANIVLRMVTTKALG